MHQCGKHTRAKGKTAPEKYNVFPLISKERGRKCPVITF